MLPQDKIEHSKIIKCLDRKNTYYILQGSYNKEQYIGCHYFVLNDSDVVVKKGIVFSENTRIKLRTLQSGIYRVEIIGSDGDVKVIKYFALKSEK